MTNKTKVLSEEKKSREVGELLFNADKAKTDGLFIDKDNDNVVLKDELQKLIELPTDNPDEKYELYYKVIEKTLREKLPKGDEYKEGNAMLREEKNTFLTGHRKGRDGIRGADSRQAFLPAMQEFIQILHDWLKRDGSTFDLYQTLLEENIKRGYKGPEDVK